MFTSPYRFITICAKPQTLDLIIDDKSPTNAAIARESAQAYAAPELVAIVTDMHDKLVATMNGGAAYVDGTDAVLYRARKALDGIALPNTSRESLRARLERVSHEIIGAQEREIDALRAALRALVARHDKPHGFEDTDWYAGEVEAARTALAQQEF
jgi:uncharacterized membrane protein